MNEKATRFNPLPRIQAFLGKFVRERVSLRGVLIALFLFPLGLYLFDEVFLSNPIIIDSFNVPKGFDDAGFNSAAMSSLIANALQGLQQQANSIMEQDSLSLSSDPSPVPDINVPGTSLGIRTLVDVTEQVFRRDPMHIGGGIVLPLTGGSETANSQVEIFLSIVQGGSRVSLVLAGGPASDPQAVARKAAEGILRQINPYLLGCARLDGKDWDDAIKIAKEMIAGPLQGSRSIAKAYVLWGNALEDQGNYAGAIALYEKATIVDSTFALAYTAWGAALSDSGNDPAAIPYYLKAICLDRKFAPAYNYWGAALSNQGKNAEATPFYEKATALDPKFELAYFNLGLALANQGKNAEAIPFYAKAAALDPKDADAYNNWGAALMDLGEIAEAIPYFEMAAALDPKDPDAYNNAGAALDALGKHAEADAKRRMAAEVGQLK